MDKTSVFGYITALVTVKGMVEASHTTNKGIDEEDYQHLIKTLNRMEKNIREEME